MTYRNVASKLTTSMMAAIATAETVTSPTSSTPSARESPRAPAAWELRFISSLPNRRPLLREPQPSMRPMYTYLFNGFVNVDIMEEF